jgi:hypothetical protein
MPSRLNQVLLESRPLQMSSNPCPSATNSMTIVGERSRLAWETGV